MKIIISYTAAEEQEATAALAVLRRLHPGAKVRKSDRHPPFKHLYLTTKKAEPLAIQGKTLDHTPTLW